MSLSETTLDNGRLSRKVLDMASSATQGRVCELDGVRGLAIILVLAWHYIAGQIQVPPGSLGAYILRMFGFTWGGVDIFFVLSGYLVGGMLMRNRERGIGARSILIRRMFRIAPLYAVSLILFVIVRASTQADNGGGLGWLLDRAMPIWSYAVLGQNITMALAGEHGANWLGITWSLALDVQFYLLLAVLIAWAPPHRLVATLFVLVAAAVILRIVLVALHPLGGFAGFLLVPSRLDSVCLGALAAHVVQEGKIDRAVSSPLAPPAILAAIVGCLATVIALCAKGQGIGSIGMSAVGHLLLAVASALLILLLISASDGFLRRMFRLPFLVTAGTVSYGIYVLHQPVAGLLHHFLLGQAPRIASPIDFAVTATALIVTLMLATLSWRYFEQPLIERGRRMTSTRSLAT